MESHMNIQFGASEVFLALALISACYLCFWKPKPKTRGWRKPPEPAGAWPIIGHLPLLGPKELLHSTYGAMADKYGPAFTLRLGTRRVLVVNNWELAKECFSKNDKALATRPSSAAGKHMGYNHSALGFAPYGPYWREMRKTSTVELLSSHRLQMLKHIRVSEIDMSIHDLHDKYWNENNGKQDQAEPALVEMKRWFEDLTLNVIVRMIAGKRHYGTTGPSDDDEESMMCRKVVSDLTHLMGIVVASDALPILGWFDLQGFEGDMKRTFKDFDALLSKWLKEHRLKKESSTQEHEAADFIDVMLSMMNDDDPQLSGRNADTAIKATCLALVAAGSDTTVISLTWALSLLLNNRHVLKKAQAELDSQVGRDRQVNESDIQNLVYLQAIVKETLRLYPAAPVTLPHKAMEDCTIGSFDIQAGTVVLANLWKIHRDPSVWTDPSEFKPERFVTDHSEKDFKGQHFEFIPFGAGRRMCPGIALAVHVLHLTLARLLHEFELDTPSGNTVDMTEGPGVTLPKATPLKVLIKPRLPFTVSSN